MYFVTGLILFLSSITISIAQNCREPISLDEFNEQVLETRKNYFPELVNTKIKVTTFNSDNYFLQAQPEMKTIFNKTGKRTYEVQLNLRLLACPPEMDALQAILVHELEHVKDYESWTSTKIAGHALKYVTNNKFRTKYERETDLKTMLKGLSQGLIGYRLWVYQWLNPKQLKIKQRYYFTPEEILDWEMSNQSEKR
jgi:hypothetical protein